MIKKIWHYVKRIMLYGFISSFLYLIICKWVMPPITLTQLYSLISGDGLKRDYVSYNEISSYAKLAAIAAEDQLFPEHSGFDWASIKKSFEASSKNKNKVAGSGTSTISQQVAKNVFLWQGDGFMRYVRKVPEAYFTKLIEWIWGKKRILEVYLNTIEMGKGIYGIEAASQAYYHKTAKNLSKPEAAAIMACLPNPKEYTVKPESGYVANKKNWIMRQMNNIAGYPGVEKLTQ